MGKIRKRTAKLLKNDGKGLHKTLFSRKVKSTMALRKSAKASKFEKSVTHHLDQKEQEDETRKKEAEELQAADAFIPEAPGKEKRGRNLGQSSPVTSDVEDYDDEDEDEVDDSSEGLDDDMLEKLGDLADAGEGNGWGDTTSDEEPTDFKTDNKNVGSDILHHKEQLQALKNQDPEFYEYLEQADQKLLAFGDEDEDSEETDEDQTDSMKKGKIRRELTHKRVQELCGAAAGPQGTLDDLNLLMAAYHAACIFGQDTDDSEQVLVFKDSNTYTTTMMFVLKEVDGIFWRHLGLSQGAGLDAIDKSLKSQPKLYRGICQYFISTMRLLSEPLDGPMCGFVLRRLRASVPLIGKKAKLAKKTLLCALGFFASEAKSPRVQAIMLIREMVLKLGDTMIQMCMKGVYRMFASKANQVNPQTVVHLSFMATCVVEIFGLNAEHAYRSAFTFIRSMAIELREAISEKKGESISKVFSWRYINCLELWARLVSTHIGMGDMQHLVYPVAQLLLGVLQFRQQKKYLPTRLRIVRTLNSLSTATGYYIPVSSYLMGILQWASQNANTRPTPDDTFTDLSLQLKVSKGKLSSVKFQEEVVEQAFELLARHLAQWSHSISFPEHSFWICFHLKKLSRNVRVPRFQRLARQVLGSAEECTAKIKSRRDAVDFSPKDLSKVNTFEEEGKHQGKSPLEVVATELEKAAKKREDIRSQNEWQVEEEDSETDDSADDSDKQSEKGESEDSEGGMVLENTHKKKASSKRKGSPVINGHQVNGNGLPDTIEDDLLEEYVMSDDEIKSKTAKRVGLEKSGVKENDVGVRPGIVHQAKGKHKHGRKKAKKAHLPR